ncbi:AAA family ATPase [Peribacillus frigoritolerans]|uniref:AAA family ATPase n=1 Tax=Peribacillus frigoritolerans TaxID=450367 RepID=UPI0021AAD678|nr:AAA family ATPase [Peribacillus frigoritolerans]MCT4477726.1 AAA family ATPase [Peribacillus frigoritolerans]
MDLIKIRVKGSLELNIKFKATTVILGENGAGKTTLMNLILYALGTKIDDFIDEIKTGRCTQVELDIRCKNNNKYRLIRSLPKTDFVTIIPLDDELNLIDNEVDMFDLSELSDFILKQEGYDLQKISFGKNSHASLRFYFLLRAIFVDQNTPASSIFSNLGGGNTSFISNQKLIKKAIIEQLLGKENTELQNLRFELQSLTRKKSELTSSFRVIKEIIKEQIVKDDDQELIANKQKIQEKIEKISEDKVNLTNFTLEDSFDLYAFNNEAKQKKLIHEQNERKIVTDHIRKLKLEIMDINSATSQIKEEIRLLKKKMVARQFFTQIPVDFCPICLSEIKEHKINENCSFCNEQMPILNDEETFQYRKLLTESVKESEKVKNELQKKLAEVYIVREKIDKNIDEINKDYIQEKNNVATPLESIVHSVKERLEYLIKSEEKYKNFLNYLEVKDSIAKKISDITLIIQQKKGNLITLENDYSVRDIDKTNTWESLFKLYLSSIFPNVIQANLDENYTPFINGKDIKTISSASLKVVTRLTYVLSLFNLKDHVDINHIGFVLYDSPRDKDLDYDKYVAFLKILNENKSGQIILTGSIEELDLYKQVFKEKDMILEDDKILKETKVNNKTTY